MRCQNSSFKVFEKKSPACNYAVYFELARYPLYIRIYASIYK